MKHTRDVNMISPLDITYIESWRVEHTQDESADDSDKIFTVPAGLEWQVLWIWVELVTTATVGNRQLEIQLQDAAADVIGVWHPGITQAASLDHRYLIAPAMPDLNALYDTNFMITPLPAALFLSAGQSIRIYDNNAVDAAADDMNVQIQYAYRAV